MRLLVTRPEPDAGALAEELRTLGHEPVLQPLLEFHVLDFDLGSLKTADALIFTSRNGLRALSEKLDLGSVAHRPV
jgi:uroporphyrinogen-III synthase